MNIQKKITITLSPSDVKKIIAKYLTGEGYDVTTDDVTLHIGTRWEGFGRSEYQVHYFKECTAVMKGETK